MKTAKDLDLGRIEVMIDKSFYKLIDKMKRQGLEGYIREGWEKRLNTVQLKINTRLRSTAGRAFWNIHTNDYRLELHPELPLNAGIKHKSIRGTIDHEVLHLIMLESDNRKFHYICDKLNIEKFHKLKFSTREEIKYKTYCTSCGKNTGKYKRKAGAVKNPQSYHSTCCKARIRVEEI